MDTKPAVAEASKIIKLTKVQVVPGNTALYSAKRGEEKYKY